VAELARRLELPRATVHRLLAALTHRGFLAQNERSGKYRLGLKLFELGNLVANSLDVKRIAHPHLLTLMRQSGETTHLVVLDGLHIVFVDKVETANPFRMVSQIGGRLPAWSSGSGKALLAQLPPDELRRRLAQAAPEVRREQVAALLDSLAAVRQHGWAVDDQETQVGLRCVGAAIHDYSGAAVAGVSISGPLVRLGDERLPDLARLVGTTASTISRALGYPG
jgi:DNA-binding IclR family transcriptional regulator